MKKLLDITVSFGAAVVIFGAWAKLLHKPYADLMLTVGLLTEAGIFIMYGIQSILNKDVACESTHPTNSNDIEKMEKEISKISNKFDKIFK